MRDAILEKLREVEDMLATATCEGDAIAKCEPLSEELTSALNLLVERVDYYVD
jgi:hypothetical protein